MKRVHGAVHRLLERENRTCRFQALVSCQPLLVAAQLVGSDQRGDSEELIDAFLGRGEQGRSELIMEATTRTAYRQGDWVFVPPIRSRVNKMVNIELGNSNEPQLYYLTDDIGQQVNLADSEPEKLQEMTEAYERIRNPQR